MPMEGHWERVNTPLRGLTARERNVAIAAVTTIAVAMIVLIVVTAGNSRPPLSRGCVSAIVPGIMGGVSVEACGAQAKSLCAAHARREDPGSIAIEESCRRYGIN